MTAPPTRGAVTARTLTTGRPAKPERPVVVFQTEPPAAELRHQDLRLRVELLGRSLPTPKSTMPARPLLARS